MDDNATCIEHSCSGLLDSEGIQRIMASAFSRFKPIENVGCFGEASCWSKLSFIRALTEEWDKLPQQLLDNVVQIEMRPSVELVCVEVVSRARGVAAAVSLIRVLEATGSQYE
ncbi:hypothetical protein TNCV_1832991 [Trichonephila clavipes]|nr:hypothetical protein TNCV_1832991 [Trichonephila clavipes]